MKKKNGIFKVLSIVILAYCVLSWVIPTYQGFGVADGAVRRPMGIFYLFQVPLETFGGFINVFLFILVVGGLYGVLKASGVYKRLLNKTAKVFKGKEKGFLLGVIIFLAIISSVAGLDLGLFVLFPFLISVLLIMGYDKITGLLATLGATVVGMFGSTLSGSLYKTGNQMMSLSMYDGIIFKVALLVIGVLLLVLLTFNHIKKLNNKTTKEQLKKDLEVELEDIKEDRKKSKKPVWPILLVIGLLFLVLFLGTTSWGSIFEKNLFDDAHEFLMGLKIGEFPIFQNLFGGLPAFGSWEGPLRLQYYSLFTLIAIIIIAIIYKVKLSDLFEGFVTGIKDNLVAASLAILGCSIFVFMFYFPVFNTIGSWIMGISKEFNVALTGIFTLISGAMYGDFYYFSYYVLPFIQRVADNAKYFPLVNVMFTSLYSLVMLVAPTSSLLIASLCTTGVSYKEWWKNVWKLFLSLLIVAFIVFTFMLLLA